MGATAVIGAAVLSSAATVYSVSNAPKANAPKPVQAPKLPTSRSMGADISQAQERARSAGGTILSDQKQNQQISDGANATRKSLLGT